MASPPPPLAGGSTTPHVLPPSMVAGGSTPLHDASLPLSGRHLIPQPHLQEQGTGGINDGRRQHQRKQRPQDRRERDPLQEKQAQEGGFILSEEADANTGKGTRRKEDHVANVKRGRQQQKAGRRLQDQQKHAPLQKEQVVSSSFAAATPVPTFTNAGSPSLAQEGEVLSSVRKHKVLIERVKKVSGSQRLRSPVVTFSVKSPALRILLSPRINSPSASTSPSPSPSAMIQNTCSFQLYQHNAHV